jgi:hypothetical protein
MSDAVSFATSQYIQSAPAAADGGHGRHRGSASSSEESRTTAGPGKHRRPSGASEEAVA